MTLSELRDALSAYPDDHPSPVSFDSYEAHICILFTAEYSEGETVGDLLLDVNSWDAGCDGHECEVETEQGRSPLAPLLRAWLGPVPVVLPMYCHEVLGRRWWSLGDLTVYATDNGGLHVESETCAVIPDETLDWLRGEVSP